MSFTTVIRPRRRPVGKVATKPAAQPQPKAVVRAILHLKASSGA
jgi:hypothetical protein